MRSTRHATFAPICIGTLALSQVSVAEESSCELDKPPKDAVAFSDHGSYFFVFPGVLDAKHTGCQTTWEEHGNKLYVLEFKDGEPVEFRGYEPPGHLKNICDYAARQLRSNEAWCPTYDEAKLPVRNPIPDENIAIPPERDPRN